MSHLWHNSSSIFQLKRYNIYGVKKTDIDQNILIVSLSVFFSDFVEFVSRRKTLLHKLIHFVSSFATVSKPVTKIKVQFGKYYSHFGFLFVFNRKDFVYTYLCPWFQCPVCKSIRISDCVLSSGFIKKTRNQQYYSIMSVWSTWPQTHCMWLSKCWSVGYSNNIRY